MENSSILFLDIDGVLITSRSRLAQSTYPAFDPVSCALVEAVSRHCSAKLVICSAWREGRSTSDFTSLLSSIGISPVLLHTDWATPLVDCQREQEIKAWLDAHPGTKRHAILDDDADPKMPSHHLVQPDPDVGLTLAHVIEVCSLLNVPFEPLFLKAGLKPTLEDH